MQIYRRLLTHKKWVAPMLILPFYVYAMEEVGEGYSTPSMLEAPLQVTPCRFRRDQESLRLRLSGLGATPEEELGFRPLTSTEIEESRAEIRDDGILYRGSSAEPLKGQFLYFLDFSDQLYVWPFDREPGVVFHSSFDLGIDHHSRRGSCRMAGELKIFDTPIGKKILINSDSGHYKPGTGKSPNRSGEVESVLRRMGFRGPIEIIADSF